MAPIKSGVTTELVLWLRIGRLLKLACADHRIVDEDRLVTLTASLGVAAYPESGDGDAPTVTRRADTALYRAKQGGKNRVEIFWPESDTPGTLRAAL